MCLIHIPEPVGSERDLDICSLFFLTTCLLKCLRGLSLIIALTTSLIRTRKTPSRKAEAQDIKVSVPHFLEKRLRAGFHSRLHWVTRMMIVIKGFSEKENG